MDLGGDEVGLQVELAHEGGEDLRVLRLHDSPQKVVLFAQQAALADLQHAAARLVVAARQGDHIAVYWLVEDDFLAGSHRLQCFQLIAEFGGLFKAEFGGRLPHLLLQFLYDFGVFPPQEAHGAVD